MKLTFTPEATERFEEQIGFLVRSGAIAAAERLRARTLDFLHNHLARFPRTGRRLEQGDLWESWIPGTRLVVWYRIDHDHLRVVTFWHTSQDRSPARS